MNFMEAVEAMKQGKKTKHDGDIYFYEKGQFYINNKIPIYSINIYFDDDYWEVVEEKKTLWDKRKGVEGYRQYCEIDDVKEALKEFIDYVEEKVYISEVTNTLNKAKEIFGEELFKELKR